MQRVLVVIWALVGCGTGLAQDSAWQPPGGSGVCVAASATAGVAESGAPAGCRAIEIGSDAFEQADGLLRPGGPHRFAFDPITTARERARRADACCYQLQYPPPPGG